MSSQFRCCGNAGPADAAELRAQLRQQWAHPVWKCLRCAPNKQTQASTPHDLEIRPEQQCGELPSRHCMPSKGHDATRTHTAMLQKDFRKHHHYHYQQQQQQERDNNTTMNNNNLNKETQTTQNTTPPHLAHGREKWRKNFDGRVCPALRPGCRHKTSIYSNQHIMVKLRQWHGECPPTQLLTRAACFR